MGSVPPEGVHNVPVDVVVSDPARHQVDDAQPSSKPRERHPLGRCVQDWVSVVPNQLGLQYLHSRLQKEPGFTGRAWGLV